MRINRSAALAFAAVVAVLGAFVAPGGAVAGQPSQLTGTVSCDNTTGEQIVTWTFQNFTIDPATINSTSLDQTGLTAGSVTSGAVVMAPSPVASNGSATGSSTATIDAIGTLTLTVNWFNASTQQNVDSVAGVTLTGDCVAAPTTTVVDTTVVDTTIADTTTVLAGSGGSIPQTGQDGTLAWLAAAFVAAGATLLVVRRRSYGR